MPPDDPSLTCYMGAVRDVDHLPTNPHLNICGYREISLHLGAVSLDPVKATHGSLCKAAKRPEGVALQRLTGGAGIIQAKQRRGVKGGLHLGE